MKVARRVAASLLIVVGLCGTAAAAVADDIAAELRRQLERQGEAGAALRAAYAARGFYPVWTPEKAFVLVETLRHADADGLVPAAYEHERLKRRLELPAATSAVAAETDIAFSRALVRYAGDLRYGQVDPQKVEPEYHAPHARGTDVGAVVGGAATAPDLRAFLQTLAPRGEDYARLKVALAGYRALAAAGGWPTVAEGPSVRADERSDRVVQLRARLAAEALAPPAAEDPELLDPPLVDALKIFQGRNGLEPDGVLGVRTVRALNTSVEARIEQIVLNLERRRWLERDLGRLHIVVNLADFSLRLVENDQTLLESRVIVGTLDNQTPIITARLSQVEFNPYWNIPYGIARKEILPEIKKDVRYLANKRIRVFARIDGERQEIDPHQVDWSRYNQNNFPFVLRQDPGDINSLGRIKFMIPNRHDIYLHDTPTRGLFRRSVRSFSHGCIRVEKARELAEVLLRNDRTWSRETISEALAQEQRRIAPLSRQPVVHIVYLTAWVDDAGVTQFRTDLYGRDRVLGQALSRRA